MYSYFSEANLCFFSFDALSRCLILQASISFFPNSFFLNPQKCRRFSPSRNSKLYFHFIVMFCDGNYTDFCDFSSSKIRSIYQFNTLYFPMCICSIFCIFILVFHIFFVVICIFFQSNSKNFPYLRIPLDKNLGNLLFYSLKCFVNCSCLITAKICFNIV